MPAKISELYYYTNVETMRYILQNGNIYATNLKYMNDSEEYSNGLVEMRRILNEEFPQTKKTINEAVLKEQIAEHPEIYSISFSAQRDLLSQWAMYSGESGVSLKMNFRRQMGYKFYFEGEKERKKNHLIKDKPKKVFYITKDFMKEAEYRLIKKRIVSEIREKYREITLYDMEGENALEVWQDMTPYVKRYEFYQEGEYRIAFSAWDFIKPLRIDYRNDKCVLKPYLDVECEDGWPVEEIIVGPGFNQQAVFMSLKHYMDHQSLKVRNIKGKKFQIQCRVFLERNGSIPDAVKSIWKTHENSLLKENVDVRYSCFREMLKRIMEDNQVDEEYKRYLMDRYLSKAGILITKSEIPYTY